MRLRCWGIQALKENREELPKPIAVSPCLSDNRLDVILLRLSTTMVPGEGYPQPADRDRQASH